MAIRKREKKKKKNTHKSFKWNLTKMMSKQQWSLEILKGTKQEQYARGKKDADVIFASGERN